MGLWQVLFARASDATIVEEPLSRYGTTAQNCQQYVCVAILSPAGFDEPIARCFSDSSKRRTLIDGGKKIKKGRVHWSLDRTRMQVKEHTNNRPKLKRSKRGVVKQKAIQ